MDSRIELKTVVSQCCVLGEHNHGGFFCAGGPGSGLIYRVKKYLNQIGWGYSADNAIYALWAMDCIDLNKTYDKEGTLKNG